VRGLHAIIALPVGVVLAMALAGCVQGGSPTSTPVMTLTPTPSASSSAAAIPAYVPGGTGDQNLAYFNAVGAELFASSEAGAASTQGRVIVDWFVAHGFDKSKMEVTPDKTSIGLAAWNIEFSVNFGKTCIIGQAGNVGFQSAVLPVLATGKCLIGQTRTIDW
jgi:hypothetical protein